MLTRALFAAALVLGPCLSQVQAAPNSSNRNRPSPVAASQPALAEKANENTVTVISGTVTGSYLRLANDMQFVLDDGDDLRILPMVGLGAQGNLKDLLLLKGVDLALVRADGLEGLKRDPRFPGVDKQVAFVTRLFGDEAHLIAPKAVTDIRQLAGKKVSFDLQGSGASYSGPIIFQRLGVSVEPVFMDNIAAYEALKKGELAAVFQMATKPVQAVANLEGDGKLHLVPIPYDEKVSDLYLPGTLERSVYPKLVDSGDSVDTISVSSILAVYNWGENTDRYRRVAKFVEAFFDKLDKFQVPGRHPKWAEVNLAANVPGWQRFKPAQQWLDAHVGATSSSGEPTRESFEAFLRQRGIKVNAGARDKLFNDYREWNKGSR